MKDIPRTLIIFGLFISVSLIIVWVFREEVSEYFGIFMSAVFRYQGEFQQKVGSLARQLSKGFDLHSVTLMLGLGFAYGFFHAVGLGHGKMVISTYLFSSGEQLVKGLTITFGAALMQGAVAIILVSAVSMLGELIEFSVKDAAGVSAKLSYILVILIGLALVYRGSKTYIKSIINSFRPSNLPPANSDEHHNHCSSCSHSHGPTKEQINKVSGWKMRLGLIASIGLRPCTGSLTILFFCLAFQIYWLGVATVIAVSLGTAVAISIIAAIAVYAARYTGIFKNAEKPLIMNLSRALTVLGGLFIAFNGWLFFQASLDPKGFLNY